MNRLSALVAKSFHEAMEYIPIDERKVAETLNWMIRQQEREGSFPEPGRVLHTAMQVSLHPVLYCHRYCQRRKKRRYVTESVYRLNISTTKNQSNLEKGGIFVASSLSFLFVFPRGST